jgi:hypothetical protein
MDFYGTSGTSLWITYKNLALHNTGRNYVLAYMVSTNFDIEEYVTGGEAMSMKSDQR